MVAGAIAGNISPEATNPFGNIFADATRGRRDEKYPVLSQSWWRDWAALTTFFDYPAEIRKVIYTTNAIESLNYSLRRVLKNRGAFPDDASVLKVLYLAIQRAAKRWTMPIRDWPGALNRFTIMFPDRMLA